MPKKKPKIRVPVWGPTDQPIWRWRERTLSGRTEVYIAGSCDALLSADRRWVPISEISYIENSPQKLDLSLKATFEGTDGNYRVQFFQDRVTSNRYAMQRRVFARMSESFDVVKGHIINPSEFIFVQKGRSFFIAPLETNA